MLDGRSLVIARQHTGYGLMSNPPFSRRARAYIGMSIGAVLGVMWASSLFVSFCFYPDDVPCNVWGLTLMLGIGTVLGTMLGGLPLAIVAVWAGHELWELIQRQDPLLHALSWWLIGIGWTAANSLVLGLLLSTLWDRQTRSIATVILFVLAITITLLWLSPRRLPARAFASGMLVGGLVLARLAGLV